MIGPACGLIAVYAGLDPDVFASRVFLPGGREGSCALQQKQFGEGPDPSPDQRSSLGVQKTSLERSIFHQK